MHSHAGRSSSLDPRRIIDALGISRGDRVMDAGCGTGYLSIAASRACKEVISVDSDRNSINALKAKISTLGIRNIKPVNWDLGSIPIEDGKIDACMLVNVLHGLAANSEKEALREIARVVRDRLIIVDFKPSLNPFGPPRNIRIGVHRAVLHFPGFSLEREFSASLFHYGIILRKKINTRNAYTVKGG